MPPDHSSWSHRRWGSSTVLSSSMDSNITEGCRSCSDRKRGSQKQDVSKQPEATVWVSSKRQGLRQAPIATSAKSTSRTQGRTQQRPSRCETCNSLNGLKDVAMTLSQNRPKVLSFLCSTQQHCNSPDIVLTKV